MCARILPTPLYFPTLTQIRPTRRKAIADLASIVEKTITREYIEFVRKNEINTSTPVQNIMARGQQKIQSQQKNAERQARGFYHYFFLLLFEPV